MEGGGYDIYIDFVLNSFLIINKLCQSFDKVH